MRRWAIDILIAAGFMPLLCLQAASAQTYASITVDQAYDLLSSDPSIFLLDVRTQSEYEDGHISGGYLITNTELEGRLNELPSDRSSFILVYCRSGARSAASSALLASRGYTNVHNMLDGFMAWQNKGYPSTVGKERGVFPVAEAFLLVASGGLLFVLGRIRRRAER